MRTDQSRFLLTIVRCKIGAALRFIVSVDNWRMAKPICGSPISTFAHFHGAKQSTVVSKWVLLHGQLKVQEDSTPIRGIFEGK